MPITRRAGWLTPSCSRFMCGALNVLSASVLRDHLEPGCPSTAPCAAHASVCHQPGPVTLHIAVAPVTS
eukprot:865689-Lingulodinium_polyedra.AAC.1